MAEIVERVNKVSPTWNLLGYLTPHEAQIGTTRNGYPVQGGPDALDSYPDACIVTDNEWPRDIELPRERLVSLIDPSSFVSRTAGIGIGCVIYPNCFIGLNANLGTQIFCLTGSVINHDCILEDRVVLASGVMLAGSVHVEANCYLGQSCTIRQLIRISKGSTIQLYCAPCFNNILDSRGSSNRQGTTPRVVVHYYRTSEEGYIT